MRSTCGVFSRRRDVRRSAHRTASEDIRHGKDTWPVEVARRGRTSARSLRPREPEPLSEKRRSTGGGEKTGHRSSADVCIVRKRHRTTGDRPMTRTGSKCCVPLFQGVVGERCRCSFVLVFWLMACGQDVKPVVEAIFGQTLEEIDCNQLRLSQSCGGPSANHAPLERWLIFCLDKSFDTLCLVTNFALQVLPLTVENQRGVWTASTADHSTFAVKHMKDLDSCGHAPSELSLP